MSAKLWPVCWNMIFLLLFHAYFQSTTKTLKEKWNEKKNTSLYNETVCGILENRMDFLLFPLIFLNGYNQQNENDKKNVFGTFKFIEMHWIFYAMRLRMNEWKPLPGNGAKITKMIFPVYFVLWKGNVFNCISLPPFLFIFTSNETSVRRCLVSVKLPWHTSVQLKWKSRWCNVKFWKRSRNILSEFFLIIVGWLMDIHPYLGFKAKSEKKPQLKLSNSPTNCNYVKVN